MLDVVLQGHFFLFVLTRFVTSFLWCEQQNRTPLHIAVSNHHTNVIRLLLDSGCDLDIPDKVSVGDMVSVAMMRRSRFQGPPSPQYYVIVKLFVIMGRHCCV